VVALAMLAVTLSIQYGLMHVQANRAIVILLFELVVAAISAYFLAGELLHGKEWLGAVMIIFASLFSGNMEHKE
jgi:drug/metabolite transporter (DMT)-like permease